MDKKIESDPAHYKVMETNDVFINEDGFDRDEASEPAIDKKSSCKVLALKTNL